jgi:hypothetical protein
MFLATSAVKTFSELLTAENAEKKSRIAEKNNAKELIS